MHSRHTLPLAPVKLALALALVSAAACDNAQALRAAIDHPALAIGGGHAELAQIVSGARGFELRGGTWTGSLDGTDGSLRVKAAGVGALSLVPVSLPFRAEAARQSGRSLVAAAKGAAIVHTPRADGVKEDIVLPGALGDALEFTWRLKLEAGLEARLGGDGAVDVYAPGRVTGAGTRAYRFPAPVIRDALGQEHTDRAAFTLEGDRFTLKATRLQDLAYPITIDPTVIVSGSGFADGNFESGVVFDTTGIQRSRAIAGVNAAANSASAPFTSGREFTSAAAWNGRLYAIAGYDGNTTNFSEVRAAPIAADGSVGTFTTLTALPSARSSACAVAYNGFLYVIGGSPAANNSSVLVTHLKADGTLEAISGSASVWTALTNTPNSHDAHSCVVAQGVLYVISGTTTAVDAAYVLSDGRLAAWTSRQALPAKRLWFHAVYDSGFIYVVGGSDTSNPQTTVYRGAIDSLLDTLTWTTVTSLPVARQAAGAAVINHNLYVLGGNSNASVGSGLATVLTAPIYSNGSLGAWTATGSLPGTRAAAGTAVWNDRIYSVGGSTDANTFPTTNYNNVAVSAALRRNDLSGYTSTTLPAPVRDHASTVYDDRLYVAGGNNKNLSVQTISATGTLGTALTSTLPNTDLNYVNDAALTVLGGRLLLLGGGDNNQSTARVFSSALSTTDGTPTGWTEETALPQGLSGHSAVVAKGRVYVLGGGSTSVYSATQGNGVLGVWSTLTSMPAALSRGTAHVWNDTIYFVGGIGSTSSATVYMARIQSDGTLGAWSSAGTLAGGHGLSSHGSVLDRGTLYVFGGAELFASDHADAWQANVGPDGTLGAWTADPTLPGTRRDHTVELANNGNILVVGGFDGSTSLSTVQVAKVRGSNAIAPAAFTAGSSGTLTAARTQAGAAMPRVGNNPLYVTGGITTGTTPLATTEILFTNDPAGTFNPSTAGTTMTQARAGHVTLAWNGNLYSFGGTTVTASFGERASIDPASGLMGNWSLLSAAPGQPRADLAGCVVNGVVYLIGGQLNVLPGGFLNDTLIGRINSAGDITEWTETPLLQSLRRIRHAVASDGRFVYVTGGILRVDLQPDALTTSVVYAQIQPDGTLGTWKNATALPETRGSHSSLVYNGNLYVIGSEVVGQEATVRSAPINADGSLGAWSNAWTLGSGRVRAASALWNDRIVTAGGSTLATGGTNLNTVASEIVDGQNFKASYSRVFDFVVERPANQSLTTVGTTSTLDLSRLRMRLATATSSSTAYTFGTTTFAYGFNATNIVGTSPALKMWTYAELDDRSFDNRESGLSSLTYTAPLANQTITGFADLTKNFGDADFTLSATASSGLSVSFAKAVPADPTVTLSGANGQSVHIAHAGTLSLVASQAGDSTYAAAPNVTKTLTVNKAAQTLSFATLPTPLNLGDAIPLSATSTAGLTVTFAVTAGPGTGTIASNTFTATGAGNVTITASQAGNGDYAAATPVSQTIFIKSAQTITFPLPSPLPSVGGGPITLGATASSGLTVSYSLVSGGTSSTLSGTNNATLTPLHTGDVVVRASQSGNGTFSAAPNVDLTITIQKGTPVLSWTTAPPSSTTCQASFTIAATSTPPLVALTYSADNTVTATVDSVTGAVFLNRTTRDSGNNDHPVSLIATLAATSDYNGGTLSQLVTSEKANQTFVFSAPAGRPCTFGQNCAVTYGEADWTPAVHGPASGTAITLSIDTGTSVTVSGAQVHTAGVGVSTVRAASVGNSLCYNAAQSTQNYIVGKRDQTLTFAPITGLVYGQAPFAVAATSSLGAGYPASISSNNSAVIDVSGSTATINGAGTATLTAKQGGDANTNAAPSVAQTVTVAKRDQTITFPALPDRVYGDSFFLTGPLAASSSLGLPISYTVTSVPANAGIAGNQVVVTAAGPVTITASQAGDANTNAATPVSQSFNADQRTQTVTITPIPPLTYGGTWTLSAFATSNGPVTFATDTPTLIAVSGTALTALAAGTNANVIATQAGTANYKAASSTVTFDIAKKDQVLTSFTNIPSWTYGDPPFTLSSSADSGLTVVFTDVSSGSPGVSINGNIATILRAGPCTIRASQPGNANYNAAPPADQTFTINKRFQTVTFDPIADVVWDSPAFDLSVSSDVGLPVSIEVSGDVSSVALSGKTVTPLAPGVVVFTARQDGDGNTFAASPFSRQLFINKKQATLTFAEIPDKTFGDAPFALSASADSGLGVTFSQTSGAAAGTLSNGTFTITGSGSVAIRATSPGNAFWYSPDSVERSFTVNKQTQTVTFAQPAAHVYGDTFPISASATSGLAVTFSTDTPGIVQLGTGTATMIGVGTASITATQAGTLGYAADSVTRTFAVSKRDQAISFAAIPDHTFGDSFPVSATADSALPVTLAVTSVPANATLSNGTLTITGTGTVSVTATQAGDSNWNAATAVTRTFNALQANQTISALTPPSSVPYGSGVVTLNPSASSGLAVKVTVTGPATYANGQLTLTSVGHVFVTLSQAGDANYSAATTITRDFEVTQGTQTVSIPFVADVTWGDAPFKITASASSGLFVDVSVTSDPSDIFSFDPATGFLTPLQPGTVTIQAKQGGTPLWAAASATRSFAIHKKQASIAFTLPYPIVYAPAYTLSATTDSDAAITFSLVYGYATVSGDQLLPLYPGDLLVAASTEATALYEARYVEAYSYIIPAPQHFVFGLPETASYGDAIPYVPLTDEGRSVSLYAYDACAYDGAFLQMTGVGTCSVYAYNDGYPLNPDGSENFDYGPIYEELNAATSIDVGRAAQTIAFAELGDQTVGQTVALSATSTAGLTVAYEVTSTPARGFIGGAQGNLLTLTSVGSITVAAKQDGDDHYLAATSVARTFEIKKGTQTIAFTEPDTHRFGDAPFALSASATSGLDVTFAVLSGKASLNGQTLTLTGAGDVVLEATQAGDESWTAATAVQLTLHVAKATQTLSFSIPGTHTFGDAPFAVSATSTSQLPVTLSLLSGPATLNGSTLTLTGAGTVTVRAHQGGSDDYAAATDVDASIDVAKAAQTISFTVADATFGDAPRTLAASSTSQLAVSIALVSGPATLTGSTLAFTGAGQVKLEATQEGDANFFAAAPVQRTITVHKAAQTLTFAAIADHLFGDTFTVSATSDQGLTPAFAITSAPANATLSGDTVTITDVGEVTIEARQAGDADHEAATPVSRTFHANRAGQTLTFDALADHTFGDGPITLAATSTAGLDVSFAVVSGEATLTGSSLSLDGAGTVTIEATQAGDAHYTPAVAVRQSFDVHKASQSITFAALADHTVGDAPITLTASASSNLDVTFALDSGPATLSGHTLTLTGAGTVSVTAQQAGNANYEAAASVTRTFTVQPAPVTNHAPVAQAQSVSTDQDKAVAITLAATDADHDPLTFTVATQPAHGTLSGTAPALTYTPAQGYTGSDSFTFTAFDGTEHSAPATVSLDVKKIAVSGAGGSGGCSSQDNVGAVAMLGMLALFGLGRRRMQS
ncbi:MAG: cadherin-like domain-containing protein [Deltaproteobacteria bacterium]|nr:cadherin-like domain-containing protein [Deltaproteobacteria bacterium]